MLSVARMLLGLTPISWRSLPGSPQHLAEFTMPCVGWGGTFPALSYLCLAGFLAFFFNDFCVRN